MFSMRFHANASSVQAFLTKNVKRDTSGTQPAVSVNVCLFVVTHQKHGTTGVAIVHALSIKDTNAPS